MGRNQHISYTTNGAYKNKLSYSFDPRIGIELFDVQTKNDYVQTIKLELLKTAFNI